MEQVIQECENGDVEVLRLYAVDYSGLPRGRVVPADDVESLFEQGVRIPGNVLSVDFADDYAADSSFDLTDELRMVPDPSTFRTVPHADRTAVVLCDLHYPDGGACPLDPRVALASFLQEVPYEFSAAFESEFYLFDREDEGLAPLEKTPLFSALGTDETSDFVLDAFEALQAQRIEPEVYYPESGPGQQELVVEHRENLGAADDQILKRRTVKAVADRNGYHATFSPIPLVDEPFAGSHIHFSLWRDGENVFYSESPRFDDLFGISETGEHFVAGVLEHAPALAALTAPTRLSFERLNADFTLASQFVGWGPGNRETTVRIPAQKPGARESSSRIECRFSDSTCNPYLALLGILAAGVDGIEREREPPEPLRSDPSKLSPEELARRGIDELPETLDEALDHLADDATLERALGSELHSSYLAVKRTQIESLEAGRSTEELVDVYNSVF